MPKFIANVAFSQMLKTQPLEFVWQSEDKISVVALRQAVGQELLRNVAMIYSVRIKQLA
ncbi:hypothetical protein INT80_14165 [Gallibacterium anatis]|uniref:Uncharacterized protein n=1 Tax=Gallibacterium anatis TaxID=750 RepID=A0A930UX96_9PAST|nr:hypothetical protein [Gallibacterium anatis]